MPLSIGVTLPPVSVGGTTVNVDAQQAAQQAPATLSTPSTSPTVTAATSKATWAMQSAETIFVNERLSTGPSAWVPYKVVYVFADGNATLVREPDCVAYTGPLLVAYNLRRQGETYADS